MNHAFLDGITVLAVATNIPAPIAAARLRTYGARVVKIEPRNGDPLESATPQWYAALTAGIEVLRLDLREPASLRTLEAHLQSADLVLTAMRARSLERMGLQWDRLHARFPRACAITLTGEAPPHDDRAGHDLTYQARAGTISAPAMPKTLIADMAAAERIVTASLAVLLARERTGVASHDRVSITDCAQSFAEPYTHGLTAPRGALGGALPTYALYETSDGYVALAALEPHFIDRLRAMLGVDDLGREALADIFKERAALDWERLAEAHDVPIAAVR